MAKSDLDYVRATFGFRGPLDVTIDVDSDDGARCIEISRRDGASRVTLLLDLAAWQSRR